MHHGVSNPQYVCLDWPICIIYDGSKLIKGWHSRFSVVSSLDYSALIELNIIFNFTLNMDHLVFIALLKLAYKHFSGSTDGSRLQKETIFYFS